MADGSKLERRLQDVLILALFVIGFFIGKNYERSNHPPCPDPKIVYERGKETIKIVKEYVHDKVEKPKATKTYAPKPRTGDLTSVHPSDSINTPCDDSIRVYVRTYSDSNATITVTDSVRGILLSQEIKAEIINRYINRVDTGYVNKGITSSRATLGPYGAINIGEKTSIVAGMAYFKGRTGYIAGYNLQNKYINLGIWYNLNRK